MPIVELERPRRGIPSPQECRAALDSVIGSAGFKSAPRLTAFLRFVVDSALSGQSGTLKAYTVAVGALGRSVDFDPATDAIVRVEAGRLRLALAHYYGAAGSADPVWIAVPRGGYVPEFRWQSLAVAAARPRVVEGVLSDRVAARAACERHRALRAEHSLERENMRRNLAALKATVDSVKALLAQALNVH